MFARKPCVLLAVLVLISSWATATGTRFVWLKSPDMDRRASSDGCGPNPITVLLTAVAEFGPAAAPAVLSRLESDPGAWRELLALMNEFDDCVRTGDGARYKRRVNSHSRWALTGTYLPPAGGAGWAQLARGAGRRDGIPAHQSAN